MSDLGVHRQQFPALADKAYFNYGGQGPLPSSALEIIQENYRKIDQLGPFSAQVNAWIASECEATRTAIAAELGAPSQTIALTEDTTVGCNIALWGLPWQAGDHLLLSDCEHPGIVAAAFQLQKRFGIEVSFCPLQSTLNPNDAVGIVQAYLRPATRLLVISHILWNTGQVLPLAEIVRVCHAQGTRVLVDAAQSVGVLPLNLPESAVDFYAFTGHKWWCGPAGVGGLYVSVAAQAELEPTFIGWRSTRTYSSAAPAEWHPDCRRYEVASSAFMLYGGLRQAIASHAAWGTAQARYERIVSLSTQLWQQLQAIPDITCLRQTAPEAGLVSFQVNGQEHASLVKALEEQAVFVRTIADPNCIRASVHYLSTPEDLQKLVDTLQAALA
ncbi:aminotransferase class V-fold PLP-dependent enzyme [Leptolyngbya sp. FACHB-261]|uniref:aminotransferase class V-fold PLP-dependent enzyme n=1 Tax=Leptolyngbya sp. FACHB-261 TaxID=2692806 RepID=UPI0028C3F4ED|nr:aminotransferase class V-fold PLP-dependent enzyme [Leptolyngbya sp. FACHB-261]